MTTQLCKNRYFADLIERKQVCTGMTKDMVKSAWGGPWAIAYEGINVVWTWGSRPHSRVVFDGDIAIEVYSDAVPGRKVLKR